MTDQTAIRWGIIGTGTIAKTFAANLRRNAHGELVAIGSRTPSKAGLTEAFPGARVLDGYQALIEDRYVEAIYIAAPHPAHAEWAIKAAQAGKHVLCEKPIAVSVYEAEAMIYAARKARTFLGEALMYRQHPLTVAIINLVDSGAVGEVRMIKANFGFAMKNPSPTHRLLANDTAGGAILDVGCYPVSMARLLAGASAGKPFLDPTRVLGVGPIGQTGVDEWASAVLQFPNGIVAEVSGSIALVQDNSVRVYGTTGWFEVKSPWFGTGKEGGVAEIAIHCPHGGDEVTRIEEPRWVYEFEIEAAAKAIRSGRSEFQHPGMSWADMLGNMRTLDRWRASIGLEYELERPARRTRTVGGRPLGRSATPMRRRKLQGIPKEVSAVGMGGLGFESYGQGSILLDAFYERGGNLLDTAWQYGGGRSDRILGDWMHTRSVRNDMIVLGKGAHSPLTYPDVIGRQLTESLDRLKTGRLDIYLMHRDNPTVPIGEFVDAMDAEVRAGRIGVYGGSNWTRERMDAAFAYAKKNGRHSPAALSNNFSLAEMVNPVWGGVVASSDDAWRAWLRDRQIPNFAWSSQARGFFTDRAGPDKRDDQQLVNAWYSDKNFARRERAIHLAKRLGKKSLHVALAYCLWQNFPVVPLIGPLSLEELDDSLEALDLDLSPADLQWLEDGPKLE